MSKIFVDKILTKIIYENNSPIISTKVIKALLELKDDNGRTLFNYTIDDEGRIVIEEKDKQKIDEIIGLLKENINDLTETNKAIEKQIKVDKEDLKSDIWSPEDRKLLEAEIKEQEELLKTNKENISKIKETIEVFKAVKEKHMLMPKKRKAKFVTTMDADVLRKDLVRLEKSKRAPFRKGIHQVLLEDIQMLEETIESSIREDGSLIITPAKFGNGIHQIDKDLFYKDKPNNIRIYFMRTGEKDSITITVLAIMDGHVGGKTEDDNYRKRIVSERQERWKRELKRNPKMTQLDQAYQDFKSLLRKKVFERESPTIDALAKAIKEELDKKKASEKKVNQ